MPSGKIYRRGKAWYLLINTGRRDSTSRGYERIRRRAQGNTRAAAQDELNLELHRLSRAAMVGGALDNRYLIADLRDEWLRSKEHRVAPRTYQSYRAAIDRIVGWLEETACVVSANQLTAGLIDDYQRAMLQEDISNRLINLTVEKLRAAIRLGMQRGLIVSDPLDGVQPLPNRRKRFRRDLHPEEVTALLEQSGDALRPLWFFLLSTGCRKGEAVELRTSDIDLKRKTVTIRARAPDGDRRRNPASAPSR